MATVVMKIKNIDPEEDVAAWFRRTFKLRSLDDIRIVGFENSDEHRRHKSR